MVANEMPSVWYGSLAEYAERLSRLRVTHSTKYRQEEMEMDKETRRPRTGSKSLADTAGEKASTDSGQARLRSELFTINDKGEYCFGTSCVSLRIKPGSGEVRVIVDRNECGSDIAEQLVDSLFGEIVKGAPTVYESKSKARQRQE